jgi:hypothetical protein
MASRVEKGRFMGVGMAGVLLLPDGGRSIVKRSDVTEGETEMPLSGELAAPVHAEPQQPSFPQWPLELFDSATMPEPEVLQEAVPSLGGQHEGSSPAGACQKTPDTSSLQLDDGANVGNANQEIPDSPQANIHEQVPGATVQQHVEVAGLEPATDTGPAGQLQTGCRRSTRIRHQQGVRKGGNAMIAVVSPQQPLLEGPDEDGLHLAEPRSHPLSPSTVQEACPDQMQRNGKLRLTKKYRLVWPTRCGSHASCQQVSMLCPHDLCWPGKEMAATKPASWLEGIGSALEETFRKPLFRSVRIVLSR